MPQYNQSGDVLFGVSSSDYRIAALLEGAKWATPTITYSFPGADSQWLTGVPSYPHFAPLDASEQDVVRQAMAAWAQYIQVPIAEVADGSTVGDLRVMLGYSDSQPQLSGGNYPSGGAYGGDIGFGLYLQQQTDWSPGTYQYMAVMHEIGHALGLKHPFDGTANLPVGEDDMMHTIMSYTGVPSYWPTTPMVYDIAAIQALYGANYAWHSGDDTYTFDAAHPYNQTIWDGGGTDTIRYTGSISGFVNLGAGAGSQLGLPVTEGGNAIPNVWIANGATIENAQMGSGNDVLVGNDASNVLSGGDGNDQLNGAGSDDTLVGGNGADTFEFGPWGTGSDLIEDFTAQDHIQVDEAVLPGTMSAGDGTAVGRFEMQYQDQGGVTTLFLGTNTTPGADVTIRVAGDFSPSQFAMAGNGIPLQSSAPPVVGGTPSDDTLTGTSGNDTSDGGGGIDTLMLPGAWSSYSVVGNSDQASVSGPQGIDSLTNVERIRFGDGNAIALDVNGDAGEAYRLYQAAFDRAPALPGLGYHINDLDNGVPLWLVAQHFIDSPEFQATYGATTDTQFITLLYRNVLDRAPDDGGLQFHLNEFAQGESRADMLCHFSESPENQASVIGQIGNGMLYVPLG